MFLARSALGRLRAVKVVRRKALKDQRAFERELRGIREFEPISRSHPAFLNILHVGLDETGEYFYCVMELGDSKTPGVIAESDSYEPKTLERVLRSQKSGLCVADVLRLGISLSDALRHLHKAGLVHRDVKPGNILFVQGEPKLGDPGFVTAQKDAKSIVGTLGYIPPEGPGTPGADLYALGKVLYESLTGLDRTNFPDLPSHLDRQADPKRFLELNQIVLKACHGPASERYVSAQELHADLKAVEEGNYLSIFRDLRSQFRKWRLRVTLAAAGIAILIVCGWAANREATHRRIEQERTIATWREIGIRAIDEGDYISALGNLADVIIANKGRKDEPLDRLRFSTTLGQIPKLSLLKAFGSTIGWCGFTPDDQKLLVALDNGKAVMLNAESGATLVEFLGHTNGIQAAAISASAALVATGGRDFTARLWDAGSGVQKRVFVHNGLVTAIQFDPTEQALITACADGKLRWWNINDGQLRREVHAHSSRATTVAVSQDGRLVVSGGRDGKVRVWDAEGQPIGEPLMHGNWVLHVALSSDGRRILVTCADKSAYLWDLKSRTRIARPLEHDRGVSGGEFSPSGRLVMTFGWDGSLRVWDTRSGARQDPIIPHNSSLFAGAFSHDGARIVTGSIDGLVRVWDYTGRNLPERLPVSVWSPDKKCSACVNAGTLEVLSYQSKNATVRRIEVDGSATPLAVNRGGAFVAVLSSNGPSTILTVWDTFSNQRIGEGIKLRQRLLGCLFIGSLPSVAFWESNSVHLATPGSGKHWTAEIGDPIRDAACAGDGSLLAVAAGTNVYLRAIPNGEDRLAPLVHSMNVERVVFDPTSEFLIACTSGTSAPAKPSEQGFGTGME